MVQTGHSIAEFSHQFPKEFSNWIKTSNYLVSLSVTDEDALNFLYEKLQWNGAKTIAFYEPDIDNQMTAICFLGIPKHIKITKKLKLALS